MPSFTARSVAALPRPSDTLQRDYWDASLPGFGLRVSGGGQRTWIIRYRLGKRRPRLSIGSYALMSLATARAHARVKLRAAEEGRDPAAEQQERAEAGTFGELAAEYLKDYAKPGKKSWKEDERIINHELLATTGASWTHVKVVDLTRPMIRELFKSISRRPAPVMANRVLALVSKMLNYALAELDWIEANPAALIVKNSETSRSRVLSDDEIRELWAVLGETTRTDAEGRPMARLNATLNDAFKMRFYTAQRGGEVFRMRWADVDLESGWWEIPGQFTKNGEVHRVPLSADAVMLLQSRATVARSGAVWVFEHVRRSKVPDRQFGNIANRGSKAAALLSRGEEHQRSQRARTRKRPPLRPGLSFQFQGHDIRRTASTNMTKAAVPRADVSKLLNHIDRGARATKVYDRYEYDHEKRAAIEAWADRLAAIIEGRRPERVLRFAR